MGGGRRKNGRKEVGLIKGVRIDLTDIPLNW